MKVKRYIMTDSQTEVLEGLREISEKLEKVLEDSYQWKWIIIALDNVILNTMVFALRDSAGVNILKPHIQKKMRMSLRDNSPRPNEKLDEFFNLYEATKGREMLQYMGSKMYVPKGKEEEHIIMLHRLRNDFIHFVPKGWLVFLDNMPNITLNCLVLISFLIFESFNFFFLLRSSQERKIKSYIYRIKISCRKINKVYEQIRKEEEKKQSARKNRAGDKKHKY